MGTVTAAQVILDAKRMADMVNSSFVSDDEWLSYVNRSAGEFHAEFAVLSEDYWMNEVQFSLPLSPAIPGVPANVFPLPVDFHKIRGLDYQVDAGNKTWRAIHQVHFSERNAYTPDLRRVWGAAPDRRWRLMRNSIWIVPEAQPEGVYRLWYTTLFQPLVTTADTIPDWEGMHEIVILGCAIRALEKEETDASSLRQEREMLRERLAATFKDRNEAEPDVVQDTQSLDISPYGRRWDPY